ncbi:hypothetical protein F4819DRAFT_107590 [Hypoxylon fuscum]|nr:hypothetical protein F4819DRAFT_107590 [Hypoxylon fuscum]
MPFSKVTVLVLSTVSGASAVGCYNDKGQGGLLGVGITDYHISIVCNYLAEGKDYKSHGEKHKTCIEDQKIIGWAVEAKKIVEGYWKFSVNAYKKTMKEVISACRYGGIYVSDGGHMKLKVDPNAGTCN